MSKIHTATLTVFRDVVSDIVSFYLICQSVFFEFQPILVGNFAHNAVFMTYGLRPFPAMLDLDHWKVFPMRGQKMQVLSNLEILPVAVTYRTPFQFTGSAKYGMQQ